MQETEKNVLPENKVPEFAKKYPDLLMKFTEFFPKETKTIIESGVELPESSIKGLEKFIELYSHNGKNKCCPNGYCEPCNRLVTSCCWAQVPSNFNGHLKYIPLPNFIYDTSCLKCIVKECKLDVDTPPACPPLDPVTFYQVRITGCIPWMASARWEAPNGICGGGSFGLVNDRKVDVCCHNSTCVDNPICIKKTKAEAEEICNKLNGDGPDSLKNCNNFFALAIPFEQDNVCLFSKDALVKFFAFWILPSC